MKWSDIKYEIIDRIAGDLLDEAYDMGIRVGAEYATRTISFRVGVRAETENLTKTQRIGYDKAHAVIQELKKDISDKTGAML